MNQLILISLGFVLVCAISVESHKHKNNFYHPGFANCGCDCDRSLECDSYCGHSGYDSCDDHCDSYHGIHHHGGHHHGGYHHGGYHHGGHCRSSCYGPPPCATVHVSPVVGLLTKIKAKISAKKCDDDCDGWGGDCGCGCGCGGHGHHGHCGHKHGKDCKWLHSPFLWKKINKISKHCC